MGVHGRRAAAAAASAVAECCQCASTAAAAAAAVNCLAAHRKSPSGSHLIEKCSASSQAGRLLLSYRRRHLASPRCCCRRAARGVADEGQRERQVAHRVRHLPLPLANQGGPVGPGAAVSAAGWRGGAGAKAGAAAIRSKHWRQGRQGRHALTPALFGATQPPPSPQSPPRLRPLVVFDGAGSPCTSRSSSSATSCWTSWSSARWAGVGQQPLGRAAD